MILKPCLETLASLSRGSAAFLIPRLQARHPNKSLESQALAVTLPGVLLCKGRILHFGRSALKRMEELFANFARCSNPNGLLACHSESCCCECIILFQLAVPKLIKRIKDVCALCRSSTHLDTEFCHVPNARPRMLSSGGMFLYR